MSSSCQTCGGDGLVERGLGPGPDVYYGPCPDCDSPITPLGGTPIPAFTTEQMRRYLHTGNEQQEARDDD